MEVEIIKLQIRPGLLGAGLACSLQAVLPLCLCR